MDALILTIIFAIILITLTIEIFAFKKHYESVLLCIPSIFNLLKN
jgi:hypothetical protein